MDGDVFTVVVRMRPGVHDAVHPGGELEAVTEYLNLTLDGSALDVLGVYPGDMTSDERD